jgi:hypothetical protein
VKWGKKGIDGYGGKLLSYLKKINVKVSNCKNFLIFKDLQKKSYKFGKKTDVNMLFLACEAVLCDKSH